MFTFAPTILGVSAITLLGDAFDVLDLIGAESTTSVTYQTEDVQGQDNFVVSPFTSETFTTYVTNDVRGQDNYIVHPYLSVTP
jgi:hypothetical protein